MIPLTRWMALPVLVAALVHCGSASDAGAPSFEGTAAAGGGPNRTRWTPGGEGGGTSDALASGGGTTTAGSAGAGGGPLGAGGGAVGVGGGPPSPDLVCPNVPLTPSTITLSVARARADVSPVQARGALLGDPDAVAPTLPAPAGIQASEFLNYYRIAYPSVSQVTAVPGLTAGAFPSQLQLQIGVLAPEASIPHPAIITALVDTSISMAGDGISRAKAALTAILASLQAGDVLNLLTAGARAPQTFTLAGSADPAATAAVASLAIDGGDGFGAAVVTAYGMATAGFRAGGTNRVVLITDGSVPESSVDFGLIASKAVAPGIRVVGVGVGPAVRYVDTLLANASEAGAGYDMYLDRVEEADVMLHQRFDEVMGVAATNVTVRVTLPWFLSPATPQSQPPATANGEPVSTDLGPGRALVYRELLSPCAPTAIQDFGAGVTMTIDVEYTRDGSVRHVPALEVSVSDLMTVKPPQMTKAAVVEAFAAALIGGDQARWTYASTLAQSALASKAFADDPDFTDPVVGIPALLAAEKPLLHP